MPIDLPPAAAPAVAPSVAGSAAAPPTDAALSPDFAALLTAALPATDRQPPAAPGNVVPDDAGSLLPDEPRSATRGDADVTPGLADRPDAAEPADNPLLGWLLVVPPPLPAAAPIALAMPVAPPQAPGTEFSAAPAVADTAAHPAPAPTSAPVSFTPADPRPATDPSQLRPQPPPPAADPAPAVRTTAAHVFAHALAQPDAARPEPLEPAPPPAVAAPSPLALAAATDARQPGLDLAQDPGLHRMIDRIELLRDAADARDTRIRLVPDALGPVDVSVRREGDRVNVHFTAEHAATRALIADAQPRLAELAEARGVRIGQASVDGGGSGERRGQPAPQPFPAPRAAPHSAAASAISTDQRIA